MLSGIWKSKIDTWYTKKFHNCIHTIVHLHCLICTKIQLKVMQHLPYSFTADQRSLNWGEEGVLYWLFEQSKTMGLQLAPFLSITKMLKSCNAWKAKIPKLLINAGRCYEEDAWRGSEMLDWNVPSRYSEVPGRKPRGCKFSHSLSIVKPEPKKVPM